METNQQFSSSSSSKDEGRSAQLLASARQAVLGGLKKAGDIIESAGDKIEHSGLKRLGDWIEKAGNTVEHLGDASVTARDSRDGKEGKSDTVVRMRSAEGASPRGTFEPRSGAGVE